MCALLPDHNAPANHQRAKRNSWRLLLGDVLPKTHIFAALTRYCSVRTSTTLTYRYSPATTDTTLSPPTDPFTSRRSLSFPRHRIALSTPSSGRLFLFTTKTPPSPQAPSLPAPARTTNIALEQPLLNRA
nr:hypothetical protein CFP56_09859 [Quercus suber]